MMTHQCPCGYQEPERLLQREEAEWWLDVSRKTLWRITSQGRLPLIRLDDRPRYLLSDVIAFARAHRRPDAD
jgi:predicted DNA-binding transcriptional regulator AlpA